MVFSDGAAFNTQSRSSLRSYANSFHNHNDFFDFIIRAIKSSAIMNVVLRSLSVNYGSVVNAAPSESR